MTRRQAAVHAVLLAAVAASYSFAQATHPISGRTIAGVMMRPISSRRL